MHNPEQFLEELRKAFTRLAKEAPPTFATLSVEEVAKELGLPPDEVLLLVSAGRLLCGWIGGQRTISRSEVERFKNGAR